VLYVSELNIEVPTCADQEAMNQVLAEGAVDVSSCWSGDCLENIIDFATALCSRDPNFSIQFWSSNESTEIRKNGHNFLIMCRDAAFKDPSFFSAYMKLVATTATGPDCAQRAFQHVKLNPPSLNWDHFFNVMNKYQRLLLNPGESTNISFASKASDRIPEQKKLDRRGPKSIRPKELEALEMIQHVIQSVITDPKLALIFFHNHEWNIVPTLISFLQCTIPSSLKGAIMKSLAIFTRVPDIAPFVWRNVVALQIIRSEQLEPASSVGNQDISFELEHYESMNQSYPATRGFLDLLLELFNSKCIENMRVGPHSESDPMIQSMLNYFDFLVQKVFQKYDLRKYEREEEKWAVVATVLSIFKEILRLYVPNSASPVTVLSELGGRLLERVLSDSSFVEKVLTVFSSDGGVASLENNSEDEKLDRAFRFCKDFISSQNEIPTGNSANSNTFTNSSTEGLFNGGSRMCDQREKSVMYGFEILLLILEKDIETISGDETQKQVKKGLRTEPLHSILLRYRSDLVNIIQYVRYTKNPIIGMLSASVLAVLSERINGPQLVDILVDSGASSEVVLCYTNRLLNMFDDIDHVERKARYGDEGNMRKRTSVLDFNTRGDGKKRTSGVLSLCESRYQTSFGLNDIRTVILDLLLANAAQPGPNLSHLLLGLLDMPKAKVYESRTRFDSCLDAILTLLSSPGFSLESSELAEKCHKLLYILLSQSNTAQVVLKIIETNRYEYFLDHMRLFVRLRNPSSHLTRSKICFTKMFGWYLKSLALYLHIGHGRDVNSKAKTNQIAAALFSTESDVISSSRQSIIVLLRMLDNFDFASSTPPIPKDPRIVSIAESCTSAFGNGAYKWLKIDVEGFYHCLKNSSLPNRHFASYKRFRLDNDSPLRLNLSESSDVENLIYWASEWNLYSEMIASEILAFDSWRQLTEIVALEYLSVEYIAEALRHTGAAIPSSPEAKIDLLGSIIRISLSKILEVVNCPAQLFEIVSHLCVCICSVLARWGNSNNDLCRYTAVSFSLFEMVIRVISSTPGAVGNVAAARNSRSLLYSCIIKLTSNLPDCKELRIFNGDASRFLTENCLDLMCQDASDGYDSLCMGLAISALESVISLETGSVLKIVKERGVLVHFVRIFAKITQIESGEGILDGKLIQGIDLPSSLGAVFDCFLSFFTMVATTPDGALALIEADLLRAMVQCPTIPTHRPKMLSSTFSGTKKQLDCNNTLFDQKWLPVLRLFVTLCSALPENELVAQNVLHFIEIHRKLFSSSFKIELEYRFGLNFLRELAYTTFLFRYVARFSENGESSLGRLRWDKFKSQILHVALSFCSDLLPPSIENDKILDQDVNRKKNSSGWWGKVKPRTLRELNEVGLTRMDLTGLQTTDLNPSALNFLSLSIFDEVKLYTSRMVLCNALSFCSSLSLNESIFPIKPTHETRLNESFALYGSRQMKYSLEAVTPCIEDFLSCFERCVDALEVGRDLSRASVEFGANARNLIEYHIDSMTFAVENMLMVLVQHFHYLSFKRESSNTRVCWLLERLLHALSVLEVSS
jgi:nuclear pore complex protein Nup205